MKTQKVLPTIFDIKDHIITVIKSGKLPEGDDDYKNFFDLTMRFYSKQTVTDKNVIFKQAKQKYGKRCSSAAENVIWNEIRTAMDEIHKALMANKATIATNALIAQQARVQCQHEILHGGDITDIFPISYLEKYFPREFKLLTA